MRVKLTSKEYDAWRASLSQNNTQTTSSCVSGGSNGGNVQTPEALKEAKEKQTGKSHPYVGRSIN